jgi:hypothetical protein
MPINSFIFARYKSVDVLNIKAYIILFFSVLSLSLQAQLVQFDLAKKNLQEGNYYKALEYFNQTISQERSGNAELLQEAYFLRGMTYIRLYSDAFSTENKEDQKRFEDALLDAYKDFKSSLKYSNGQYVQKVDVEIKKLHQPLLQEGLKSLNEYNDLVFNGKTDAKLLKRAEDYLTATHEIRDSYLVNDLLGQVALDKGQKPEAKKYFMRSADLYSQDLPEEPDFLMAYVYYRLAAINKTDSIHIALQDVDRGLRLMQTEYDRYYMMKDKLTPERQKELQDEYDLAVKDLNNIRLDLYLSNQDLYVEALHVFEEQLMADSSNVDLLIGYASLLERTDKQKAIKTYLKVLEKDSLNKLALFNIGALYYGKAKELFELAEKEQDSKQFKILTDEGIKDFESAQPYFEKVLAQDPSSLDSIQALKTIAYILDDKDAYNKYDAMEKTLEK